MNSFFTTERGKHLVNVALALLVIFCFLFFFKFINEIKKGGYIGREYGIQNSINISGVGEVVAIPDIATFSFVVRAEKSTVETAQKEVTEKTNNILDALKKGGVDEKDIKTTGYNIYPQYDYPTIQCFAYPCPPSKSILRGYEVSHSITVKVRDTENTGELLTMIGKYEVDNVSGISFGIDDEEALKAEARSLAIEDAKKQAERLAKDLGVKIVRVVSFYENNYPMPYYGGEYAMGKGGDAMMEASPVIPAGENTIISNVSVTYEIR